MNSSEQLERFYTNEASIRDLDISQRSIHLLEENNIKSIADLQTNFGSLLNIAGMDTTSLQEINQRYNQWLKFIAREIVFLKSESTTKRTSWLDRIPPGIELKEVEIEYLGLSIKTYNTLARAGITTLADIAPYNDDFMQIKARNFGPKAAEELLEKIERWLQSINYERGWIITPTINFEAATEGKMITILLSPYLNMVRFRSDELQSIKACMPPLAKK